MDGVTTAIVGFIFVCIIFPSLIKNQHQYYMALAAVLLGLVLKSIGVLVGSVNLMAVMGSIGVLLDAAAILILVMAAGGLSARQLAGDMARAYQVMRRGEEEVTTIIPREGELPRRPRVSRNDEDDEDEFEVDSEGRRRYAIDEPSVAPRKPADSSGGSIPLE